MRRNYSHLLPCNPTSINYQLLTEEEITNITIIAITRQTYNAQIITTWAFLFCPELRERMTYDERQNQRSE